MQSHRPFAKRSLGQNFLIDESVIRRIVDALGPNEGDVVVEIGPGRGALTEKLVERKAEVFAFELDTELARELKERFRASATVHIEEADALKLDFSKIGEGRNLRLVANLPYNVSTAILQRLFESADAFTECVLMFQREVVDRIAAQPGTKERGYLSVLTQAHFDVEKLFDVPPTAFRPVPNVWSSVARLKPRSDRPFDPIALEAIVSSSFAQKRKTILNNLKNVIADADQLLLQSGIDPKRRAETISLEEWFKLSASPHDKLKR
ncbi:MAG: 16S rRNA (adenine(1518)-N(6)/adenine(1519)-N(6))-dimethyltransferase [Acidobacteria bacterium]|nr:MAG: 16S rRNA (adenine(1518)-N(6)/adenine(1519)-N(6))-dimethyltransferase [Acidobacteriota bacterium]